MAAKKVRRSPTHRLALRALRAAVREVAQESLEKKLPFYVWRDDRVVELSSRELRKLVRRGRHK